MAHESFLVNRVRWTHSTAAIGTAGGFGETKVRYVGDGTPISAPNRGHRPIGVWLK